MKLLTICALLGTLGGVVDAAADRGAELAAARDLYSGADYDGALAILNGLTNGGAASADVVPVEQYRALCYLALGDAAGAQRALETIVIASPFYRPSSSDTPRFASAFTAVRQRLLPDVAQKKYAAARAAYDRHDYELSAAGFRDVMRLLNDPDVTTAAGDPLADLRLIAAGFVDLSARAPAPLPATRPAEAIAPARPATRVRSVEIYTASSADVVPPVPIKQTLPAYTAVSQMLPLSVGSPRQAIQGAVEVTIGEDGKVINAKMVVSTKTPYDVVAVAAANRWQYKPASLDGTPVKYLKVVNINLAGAP
jgi:TonB family protein